MGPHPLPMMVRDLPDQIIGDEIKVQANERFRCKS